MNKNTQTTKTASASQNLVYSSERETVQEREYKSQRDELLAALKQANNALRFVARQETTRNEVAEVLQNYGQRQDAIMRAKAAIARAEKGRITS